MKYKELYRLAGQCRFCTHPVIIHSWKSENYWCQYTNCTCSTKTRDIHLQANSKGSENE